MRRVIKLSFYAALWIAAAIYSDKLWVAVLAVLHIALLGWFYFADDIKEVQNEVTKKSPHRRR